MSTNDPPRAASAASGPAKTKAGTAASGPVPKQRRTGPCVRCNALQDKLRRAQEELKQLRTLAVLKGAH